MHCHLSPLLLIVFAALPSAATTVEVYSQAGCADCEWVRESFLPEAEARLGTNLESRVWDIAEKENFLRLLGVLDRAGVEDNERVYLVLDGARADGFAYRFSTKAQVPGVPLYYYGSRFYSPITGRWLNRDPMEESGGINLYLACENKHVNEIDPLGLTLFRAKASQFEVDIENNPFDLRGHFDPDLREWVSLQDDPEARCSDHCKQLGGVKEIKKTGRKHEMMFAVLVADRVLGSWSETSQPFLTFCGFSPFSRKKNYRVTAWGKLYDIWTVEIEEYFCNCCEFSFSIFGFSSYKAWSHHTPIRTGDQFFVYSEESSRHLIGYNGYLDGFNIDLSSAIRF